MKDRKFQSSMPAKPPYEQIGQLRKFVGHYITIGWVDASPMKVIYLGPSRLSGKPLTLDPENFAIGDFDDVDQVISVGSKAKFEKETNQ
jgi:hypothetical protein